MADINFFFKLAVGKSFFSDGFHYIINAVFHVFCVYSSVSSSLWGLLLANRLEGKGSEVLGSRVRAHTRL